MPHVNLPPMPPSPQASGWYFEEGKLSRPPSLLSLGMQATLEATRARAATKVEAKAYQGQAWLEKYHRQHWVVC